MRLEDIGSRAEFLAAIGDEGDAEYLAKQLPEVTGVHVSITLAWEGVYYKFKVSKSAPRHWMFSDAA